VWKIRTRNFGDDHFIAFADLDLQLPTNQGCTDNVTYDIIFFIQE